MWNIREVKKLPQRKESEGGHLCQTSLVMVIK